MQVSLVRLASHVHKPMIRFIGKRTYDKPNEAATSHPLAPEEVKNQFKEFLQHQKNPSSSFTASPSTSKPSKQRVLWYDESPWGYITPTESEIELINGGGVIR